MPPDSAVAGPLIGRAAELTQLARLAGVDADASRSAAVLLSGDAGVGKTRLLIELRGFAQDAGWRVLVGHCLDFGESALPYLPLGEVFARLEADSPELADAIAKAHPPVTRLMPGRRLPAEADNHNGALRVDRTELFEAVHAALVQLADDAPLLLVLEDVHWADRSTRELLSFLFARQFPAPVSVVASYRSDDLHRRHPLRATAAEWARLPHVRRLPLGPLADTDVRSLVRWLHPAPLREKDVHTVVERAEGNAFFTEELVAATELGGGALPTDLAELLLVRLDQLDEAAQLAVRVASVAGRRVGHDLLSRVVGLDAATLDPALRSAVERNVLVAVGADRYAFRHALLAEAVYDDLLPGERVRLHAAYAQALIDDDVSGSAAEVARHARAAHDVATTIRMSIRAGDDAMSVAGPDEAARHYEVALGMLAEQDALPADDKPVDVVTLTIKASEAAEAAGRPYRAVAIVEDRLRQFPPGEPSERARLLRALATYALQSDSSVDALEVTTEALQLVPVDPPSPLRARVLSVHARANTHRRRYDDAAIWAGEALTLARQFDLPDVMADATTTLAKLKERTGDPEASRHALEQIISDARAAGDLGTELRALHSLGGLHFEQGQLAEALNAYRLGTDRARELGRPWAPHGLDVRVLACLTAYQSGEWDTADRIVDVSGQAPPGMAEALLAAAGMAVAAGRGRERALDLLTHIRPWWGRDGMISVLSGGAAIDLYGDSGHLDEASSIYADVVETVTELWQPDFQARIRLVGLLLGQLAAEATRASGADRADLARRGDELNDTAGRVAEKSIRRVGRRGPESDAWIARVRAEHLRVRWLTGVEVPSEDELVASWQETVAAFQRYPHVFELARSQARLAAALRAIGRHAEARPLADAARETAERLNAQPLLTELRGLGTSGAARRTQDTRLDNSLTPREQEILTLVAQGRSNREIGGQLYISAKTVSVHVSNVLAKLGASGRTEAVAVARRRGLLTD